jgi:hypothetical protein
MAVLLEQSGRQNSAYRSGCFQEICRWSFALVVGKKPFTAQFAEFQTETRVSPELLQPMTNAVPLANLHFGEKTCPHLAVVLRFAAAVLAKRKS